jgi:hypothetical protein
MVVDIHRNVIRALFAGGLCGVGVGVVGLVVRGFAYSRRRRLGVKGKMGRLRGEEHCLALLYLLIASIPLFLAYLYISTVWLWQRVTRKKSCCFSRVRRRVWGIGIRRFRAWSWWFMSLGWRFCGL